MGIAQDCTSGLLWTNSYSPQSLRLYEQLVLLGCHWIITCVRISHISTRICNIHEILHSGW